MSRFTRMKRVTDPLDDKAKARIVGRDDDVSKRGDLPEDDVTSSNLSEIFFGFGVEDDGDSSPGSDDGSDCERDPATYDSTGASVDLIKLILREQRDPFKKVLTAHVSKAVQLFSSVRSNNKSIMRRNVMAYLRNCGYNAAVCKTKWESCGGLAAGSYEFIDVVRTENSTRYLIDFDFSAEFEIARPTESYERLLHQLPTVFVGTSEDLTRISKVVSDAARRSLKSRGLHLPPWRKNRFMQNKWMGPYRRTTNVFPASFSSLSPANPSYGVKWCAVGFDAAVSGGHLTFMATARTR